MPGSTESSAMAPASMTESPIAVTCLPRILHWVSEGDGLAVGPDTGRGTWALVAALTRSPLVICFSMPDAPDGEWKTPYPAVQVRARAAAPHNTGTGRAGERQAARKPFRRTGRSEEHTSELQSRRELVCRLLLEKKKE